MYMAVCVAGLLNEGHMRIRTALVTADLRLVKGSFFVQTGLYHIVNSNQFFPLESICLAWIDCKLRGFASHKVTHSHVRCCLSALSRGTDESLCTPQQLSCDISTTTGFQPYQCESDTPIAL